MWDALAYNYRKSKILSKIFSLYFYYQSVEDLLFQGHKIIIKHSVVRQEFSFTIKKKMSEPGFEPGTSSVWD